MSDKIKQLCSLVESCPPGSPYGDLSDFICHAALSCTTNHYGDNFSMNCVPKSECSDEGIYGNSDTKLCVMASDWYFSLKLSIDSPMNDSPSGTYGNSDTNSCVLPESCSISAPFVDEQKYICVKAIDCSSGYYGDITQDLCVLPEDCSG